MNIRIKQEENTELPAICKLIEAAFADMPESDHREHHLVDRLHKADTYIPELSLVAKTDQGEIVGYILLTKVEIVSESGVQTSLAVAPLAVLTEYQNRGIGGMLLKEAHKRAVCHKRYDAFRFIIPELQPTDPNENNKNCHTDKIDT